MESEHVVCVICNSKNDEQMYGMCSGNVNEARYEKFLATYKITGTKVFRKKNYSYGSTNLPPCQRELRQQLLRTVYITNMWRNSHLKEPTILTAEYNGWNLIDGHYVFNWYDGDTVPSSIYDILINQSVDTAGDNTNEAGDNTIEAGDNTIKAEEYISGNSLLFNLY